MEAMPPRATTLALGHMVSTTPRSTTPRTPRALTLSVSEQAALSDFGKRQQAERERVQAAETRVHQRQADGRAAMARMAQRSAQQGQPPLPPPPLAHHERIIHLVAQANALPGAGTYEQGRPLAVNMPAESKEAKTVPVAPPLAAPVALGARADAAADTAAERAAQAVIRSGAKVRRLGEMCEQIAMEKDVLGAGAFGIVYRGSISGLGRVAVKRLEKNRELDAGDFENELAILQLPEHPNLLRMLGCGATREARYLVYPLIDGGDLFSYLGSSHPTSRQYGCRLCIVQDVTAGLRALHSHSPIVLHRDLKPQNVLIRLDEIGRPGGRPRAILSDFGLSRFSPELRAASHLTSAHAVGTQGYLAPEILLGQYSMASDVYSLGVLLLQCATGRMAVVPMQGGAGGKHLSAWAREARARRDTCLADPRTDFPWRLAEALVCVGLDCCASAAVARPSLDAVRSRLETIAPV